MRDVNLRSKLYCAGPAGAAGVGGGHVSLPGLGDAALPMIALLVFFTVAAVWMFRRWGQPRAPQPVPTVAHDAPSLAVWPEHMPASAAHPAEQREQDRELVGV